MLVNNLCESFNAHILEARDQPVIALLETIREYIMDRIQQRKAAMEKCKGPIGPLPREIVDERVKRSTHWNPIWNAAAGYQVKGPKGDQYAVDLKKRHCTCKLWAVSGIPCCHAIAAIHRNNGDPYNELEGCYSTDLFLKIYCNVLQPISGEILWPPSTMPILDPPLTVAQPGRPRKARRRDITEGKNHGRKLRRRIVIHCRKCGKTGHNAATCCKERSTQSNQVEEGTDIGVHTPQGAENPRSPKSSTRPSKRQTVRKDQQRKRKRNVQQQSPQVHEAYEHQDEHQHEAFESEHQHEHQHQNETHQQQVDQQDHQSSFQHGANFQEQQASCSTPLTQKLLPKRQKQKNSTNQPLTDADKGFINLNYAYLGKQPPFTVGNWKGKWSGRGRGRVGRGKGRETGGTRG